MTKREVEQHMQAIDLHMHTVRTSTSQTADMDYLVRRLWELIVYGNEEEDQEDFRTARFKALDAFTVLAARYEEKGYNTAFVTIQRSLISIARSYQASMRSGYQELFPE
jgi:hypothetical protein